MEKGRAFDWFRQAENDLEWGTDTLKAGKYSQACFISQQVGEKALKAVAYFKGYDMIKSHSILEIARSLDMPDDVIDNGKKLDLYYISTRYPDAFPSGAPYEYFTKEQADEALANAASILEVVRNIFNEK